MPKLTNAQVVRLNNSSPGAKQVGLGTVLQRLLMGTDRRMESFDGTNITGNAAVDECDSNVMSTRDNAAIFNSEVDTAWKMKGTGSVKLSSPGIVTAGDHKCYRIISSADWSESTRVGFWARSDVSLAAGDVQLYIRDNVASDQVVNLPALTAGVPVWCELDVSALTLSAVIRYGFKRNIAKIFNLNVDFIHRYKNTMMATLTGTPVGVVVINTLVKANTGTHTLTTLTEDTDFIIGTDVKRIIFLTDQSTKACVASYMV